MIQDTVYVTGHQHPDTDSIAAAIGYAFYKRAHGVRAVPCRLGKLSMETKFLLNRFGFEQPMYLDDARVRLSEIQIDAPIAISPDTTILEARNIIRETGKKTLGVVDDSGRLIGLVTKNDIANVALDRSEHNAELVKATPTEYFARTLNGTVVYDDPERNINGRIGIIPITDGDLSKYKFVDRIVIAGDSQHSLIDLMDRGAGMLILIRTDSVSEEVIAEAKLRHVPIILSGEGTMNTSRYVFFAAPVKEIMTTDLVTFFDYEFAEDVGNKMMRSRFHSYPVVNDERKLIGYASRYHIMNAKNKKIILVDHNEFTQSVKSIEKAEVLEVIDHHRINDFSTKQPVNFRNEIVGSSATIVATVYRENQIPIPPNIAGLLLGAILSDTLKFQSPTCTKRDIDTANILAALADLDIDSFAKEMFSAGTNLECKTIEELINQDIKFFDIEGCKTMISQVIVSEEEQVTMSEEEIQSKLDVFTRKKNLDLCILAVTSILENGSIFYAAGEKAAWAREAFPNKENEQHSFQTGIVSRKKQIVPIVTGVISKYA